MTAPQLTVYHQGQGVVSGDGANTFEQTTDAATDLRAFIGTPGLQVAVRGNSSVNDGGAGSFYWSANGTGPDDGVNIIVPTGAARGCWIRLTQNINDSDSITGSITYLVSLAFDENGGGSVLPTGIADDYPDIPFAFTITRWTIQADQVGSLQLDLWAKTFAPGSPPTIANTIVAAAPPSLSSAQSRQSSTLTGWTTVFPAGTHIRLNINSIATITRFTLTLTLQRTVTF